MKQRWVAVKSEWGYPKAHPAANVEHNCLIIA